MFGETGEKKKGIGETKKGGPNSDKERKGSFFSGVRIKSKWERGERAVEREGEKKKWKKKENESGS